MDFEETCNFFGGSIFYDDVRGNLDHIHARLDERWSKTPLVHLNDTASLLLLRAIWNLLRGEFHTASEYLDCLIHDEQYGARWAFRAHAYTAMVHTWRHHPRLYKSCDLSGPTMVTWRNHNPVNLALKSIEYCRQHRGIGKSIMDSMELRIIEELCRVDHVVRTLAFRLNPLAEDYTEYESTRAEDMRHVASSMRAISGMRALSYQLGLPAVSAYLSKQLFELFHAQGSPYSYGELEMMRSVYRSEADVVGEGLYWMTRGDFNASPPFTSLLALNFDIADRPDEFGGESKVFHVENVYPDQEHDAPPPASSSVVSQVFKGWQKSSLRRVLRRLSLRLRPKGVRSDISSGQVSSPVPPVVAKTMESDGLLMLPSLEAAMHCFEKADQCFKKAGSSRGRASLALRRACCLVLAATQPRNDRSRGHNLSQATTLLQMALDLAKDSGDSQLAQVAQVHLLLIQNVVLESRATAREIGRSTEESGNDVLGLCLGLLALRQSLHFKYLVGSAVQSHSSLEVARQIIKSMSIFRALWFQIMITQAEIWTSSGFSGGPAIWIGHLKERHWQLGHQCLAVSSTDDPPNPVMKPTDLGKAIYTHYLKLTVAAAIAIDSCTVDAESFPGQANRDMLDLISKLSDDRATDEWIQLQELCILYRRALLQHKQHVHQGNLGKANATLKGFLSHPKVAMSTNLEAKCLRIEIAVKYGQPETAEEILATVDDQDMVVELYTAFDRSTLLAAKWQERTRKQKSLELIFFASVKVGNWERAEKVMTLLEDSSPGFFTSVGSYTRLWPWQRCLYAGLVHERAKHYNLALQYFMQSWFFLKEQRDANPEQEERRQMWQLPDVTLLFGSLVRRSLMWQRDSPDITKVEKASDPRFDGEVFPFFTMDIDYTGQQKKHFDEAVLFMEACKSEHVWRESTDVSSMETWYKYRTWGELKAKLNRTTEEEREFQRLDPEKESWNARLWGDVKSIDRRLRDRDQDEFFPHSQHQLYEAIPENAIVIYTGLSEVGFALMVIDQTGVIMAAYDDSLTPSLVRNVVLAYLDALLDQDLENADSDVVLKLMSTNLSHILIEPAERCIDKRNHVIFVLSGDLTLVPVGALLYRNDYLGLQREVSQVPSLAALKHLRTRPRSEAKSSGQHNTTIIARPGGLADQLETGIQPLPMAGVEAMLVGHLMGKRALDAKDVDREQFQGLLRDSDFLHICTHGQTDPGYAFNSHIQLKEQFRVLDMLAVRTEVALVTFSACLSSHGHASDSGDIQGFSHAVLAAGANAYLGALWEVNDVATMIHMYLFYGMLLMVMEKPTLSEAWFMATKTLCELSTEETIDMLQKFMTLWDLWESRGEAPSHFVKNGRKKLLRTIEALGTEEGAKTLNFRHPSLWAGFTLVGNASLRVYSSGFEQLQHLAQERGLL
ncbi:hypothetical protein CC79DRAFT_1330321 [Sarocladium strictum]